VSPDVRPGNEQHSGGKYPSGGQGAVRKRRVLPGTAGRHAGNALRIVRLTKEFSGGSFLPGRPPRLGPSRCCSRSVCKARTHFLIHDSGMLKTTTTSRPQGRWGKSGQKRDHDIPVPHTHASAKFSDQGMGPEMLGPMMSQNRPLAARTFPQNRRR
jgi:hypothetical protein